MSQQTDIIASANALSTASDGLSLKLDSLVSKVDAVLDAIANGDLTPSTPEGDAAIAALKASSVTAAAAGDKVDAEVAKLDTVLPTPAPAGGPVDPNAAPVVESAAAAAHKFTR